METNHELVEEIKLLAEKARELNDNSVASIMYALAGAVMINAQKLMAAHVNKFTNQMINMIKEEDDIGNIELN